MKHTIALTVLLASAAAQSESMHEWQSVDLVKIKPSYSPGESRVTMRMPAVFPTGYWVLCDYYDSSSTVMASIKHVMRMRVWTLTVEAPPEQIAFALCRVPGK